MEWVVIMEWDGKKVPNTFYNRLKVLGLQINRDAYDPVTKQPIPRNPNPLQRRSVADGMVTIQEGCIITATEKTARTVAMYARDEGCGTVRVGKIECDDFSATTEDVKIMQKIESLAGKRGRRSADEANQDWDVVCYDELGVYTEPDARFVLNCPHCGSMSIKYMPKGKIKRYKMPDDMPGETMLARWMRAAFANGEYVPISRDGELPPPVAHVPQNGEAQHINIMMRSPALMPQKPEDPDPIAKLGRYTAGFMLDAVLISRMVISRETRVDARVRAAVRIFQDKAVDATKVPVSEEADKYDLLDTACINAIGIDTAAGMWKSLNM